MAEIKSTLDLVMEKTKHLSLNDEEKLTQTNSAMEKRVSGVLKKCQDQILSRD